MSRKQSSSVWKIPVFMVVAMIYGLSGLLLLLHPVGLYNHRFLGGMLAVVSIYSWIRAMIEATRGN